MLPWNTLYQGPEDAPTGRGAGGSKKRLGQTLRTLRFAERSYFLRVPLVGKLDVQVRLAALLHCRRNNCS